MPDMFTVDFKQLDKFVKFSRKQSIGIGKFAMETALNNTAWDVRSKAQKVTIPRLLTTRSKFNQSLIRVTTAKAKRGLTSVTGAINKKNYLGLRNVELGLSVKNEAIPHVKEVRGGNIKRKVPKAKRLRNMGTIKQIRNKRELRALSRSGYTGYFKKIGTVGIRPGIFHLKSLKTKTKLTWVRDTTHKTTKTRKIRWLKKAIKIGTSAKKTGDYFNKSLNIGIARKFKSLNLK